MASTTLDPHPSRPVTSRPVWPALVLIALGIACYFSIYLFTIDPENTPMMLLFMLYMNGAALCALLLAGWWLIWGSAPFRTRLLALGVAVLLGAGAMMAADSTMQFQLAIHGIPAAMGAASLALLVPGMRPGARAVTALLLSVAVLGTFDVLRSDGLWGRFATQYAWRWTPTNEEKAKAYAASVKELGESAGGEVPAVAGTTDWPGFRGAKRDGIATVGVGDWAATLPREAWRHPVGPAWSSFCVVGDRAYTQEQLGDQELVTCYRLADGQLIWKHAEANRHYDGQSGAGPRGTPTFAAGKVYSLGAKGLLTCLDAADGKLVWKADLKETIGDTMPTWGISGSPLVVGDKVIVNPGVKGTPEKPAPRLMAFDAKTGANLWAEGVGNDSYCSPQLAELAGVQQVLIFTNDGLAGHDSTTGKELWQYAWSADGSSSAVCQPLLLGDGKIVIGGGRIGIGSRCIQVAKGEDGWTTNEVWKTKFSPGFNDFIQHAGFIYGLESGRLVCLEAATGKQRWRDGNFGAGEVLLAGDKLVIQSEDGPVYLVNPSPDGYQEVAELPALKDKTWNHPVVANGRLLVRNAQEAVCFNLGTAPGQ